MTLPHDRPWLSEIAARREADVLESVARLDAHGLLAEIDAQIDRSREIHEVETLNLNPATNVMNPRAEAALARGLSSRPSLGHPGEKYEVGLEAIETLEVITADLARQVFNAAYAEIRPFSGAMANLMAFMACAGPGDSIIVPPASIGGHVTHNTAGAAGLFGLDVHEAPIDATSYTVDVNGVAELAARVRPRLITIGSSLNLAHHPVAELRQIADSVDARLLFDAAHLCGPIAGGAWPNPLRDGAHLMTMSTYKSLGGPAGGLVVTDDSELAGRIDAIAYPGLTANFDAGRTTALAISLVDWVEHGHAYAEAMVDAASALADALVDLGVDLQLASGRPTVSHQLAIKCGDQTAADDTVQRLRAANLLTCAIGLPEGVGVRIGTPEAVRWGMGSSEMVQLAAFIDGGLKGDVSVGAQVTQWRSGYDRIHFCV